MPKFNVIVYRETRTEVQVDAANSKAAIDAAHDTVLANPNNFAWVEVPDSLSTDEGLDVSVITPPAAPKDESKKNSTKKGMI